LRNYTTLVPPAQDFPLSRFISRTDTITKAVGYDKGAMVFHMLRHRIGEDAFWGSLRDIYRDRVFQAASWMICAKRLKSVRGSSWVTFSRSG